jgi:hypothetical protein
MGMLLTGVGVRGIHGRSDVERHQATLGSGGVARDRVREILAEHAFE